MREKKKATSVKYQHLINAMKAYHTAKDKVKTAELDIMTECYTSIYLLRFLTKMTSTIEDELTSGEEDLGQLESTFTEAFNAIPPLNLPNVAFTPYSELGSSDVKQTILVTVDKFESNIGLMSRNASRGDASS